MTDLSPSQANAINAAFLPLYKTRLNDFPVSLRDEVAKLAGAVKVGGAVSTAGWLEDGWKLYKAASLGLQPASARGKMKGPLESQVFIGSKSLCTEVQKAFIATIVPPAKELPASYPMEQGLREYLAGK